VRVLISVKLCFKTTAFLEAVSKTLFFVTESVSNSKAASRDLFTEAEENSNDKDQEDDDDDDDNDDDSSISEDDSWPKVVLVVSH